MIPFPNSHIPADARRHTTLVVDDVFPLCMLTAAVLAQARHHVLPALCGKEALEIARECPQIDLLVTDIEMPEMDGVELATRFAQIHPDAGIVFVSGGEHEIHCPEPHTFVHKPYTAEILLAACEESLRMRAMQHRYSSAA